MPPEQVHRAPDRFLTETEGIESRHSFSFGRHYDAANTSYGGLLAHNEDVIEPGAGYPTHAHRDLEIVTWVLEGALVHEDSTGAAHVLRPGSVQRVSAGRGIRHSERAAVGGGVHLVQMWVRPDETGLEPSYAQDDVDQQLSAGGLVPVASGMPRHATSAVLRLATRSAALHAARLSPAAAVELPDAPYVHLFVARGEVTLEGAGALAQGDAVRLTGAGAHRATAHGAAEVLAWELHTR